MVPGLLLLLSSLAAPARAQMVFARCHNDESLKSIAACSCGNPVFGPKEFRLAVYNQGKVPLDELSIFVNGFLKNANDALKKYNAQLDTSAQFPATDQEHWDTPIADKPKLCGLVDAAFKAHPPGNALPVFFLNLDGDMVLGADAVGQNYNQDTSRIECGDYADVSAWPDFIIISDRAPKTTTQVLLHEIGHAVGHVEGKNDVFQHSTDDPVNIMVTGASIPKAEDVSMNSDQLAVFCHSRFTQ